MASTNVAIIEVLSTNNAQTTTIPSIIVNGITYVPASTPTISRTHTPTGSLALCMFEDNSQPILDKDYYYNTFWLNVGKSMPL